MVLPYLFTVKTLAAVLTAMGILEGFVLFLRRFHPPEHIDLDHEPEEQQRIHKNEKRPLGRIEIPIR